MKRSEIKKVNNRLIRIPTYCDFIPINTIDAILKENGLLLIQEDYTAWSGILCGDSGHDLFDIGYYHENAKTYYEVQETKLYLSWYKMQSGRYEIVTYLT